MIQSCTIYGVEFKSIHIIQTISCIIRNCVILTDPKNFDTPSWDTPQINSSIIDNCVLNVKNIDRIAGNIFLDNKDLQGVKKETKKKVKYEDELDAE